MLVLASNRAMLLRHRRRAGRVPGGAPLLPEGLDRERHVYHWLIGESGEHVPPARRPSLATQADLQSVPSAGRETEYSRWVTVLPSSSVLVRTWFGDDGEWLRLIARVRIPSGDGFLADVTFVDDLIFEGLSAEALQARQANGPIVSFIADKVTLTVDDQPIMAVWVLPRDADDDGPEPEPFRVVPSEIWSVENNINLANMDWQEFSGSVDADGIFRGF